MRSSGEGDEWDNGSWKEKTSRIKDLIILEDENEGMTEENAKKFSSFFSMPDVVWIQLEINQS